MWKEAVSLWSARTEPCDVEKLRARSEVSLDRIFHSATVAGDWARWESRIASLGIPDGTGGVNPGDRRAIYSVVRQLAPQSVLEIGTHIGASTIHIAAALADSGSIEFGKRTCTTVDIRDVNSVEAAPWRHFGMRLSPRELLQELRLQDQVIFETSPAGDFLQIRQENYDLIFLDGDHSAAAVLKEVPAALKLLKPNGMILLHDYFPDLKPLWRDGIVIPGPFLAIRKLRHAGARCTALPIGKLPWPTKADSNVTSLALLLREA
ncbi:MAG: class I SAM-dependent methyltransferase [Proteobacteria bacterium]|nr:class I SAM-dependent methyltransferase [Pseudomonadota bacterium]